VSSASYFTGTDPTGGMRSTGDDTVDDPLGGGFPDPGTFLLTGGSGGDKSRLATTVLDGAEGLIDDPPCVRLR